MTEVLPLPAGARTPSSAPSIGLPVADEGVHAPALAGQPPKPLVCEPPKPMAELNQQARRIQELIERAESLPDPAARKLVNDCLTSLLALYGDGLARFMEIVTAAGAAGEEVLNRLAHDPSVRGLLLIHGLHPLPLESRLGEALDTVRPYMQSHGGSVELLSLENGFARLRLKGTCQSCPSSSVTLELAVRRAIEEVCPDLAGYAVE